MIDLNALMAGLISAIVSLVIALLGQRNQRNKPAVDKAEASDKLTDSGVRLSDAALRYAAISEARAKELVVENETLARRIDELDLHAVQQAGRFAKELADQKTEIDALKTRVADLEDVLGKREAEIDRLKDLLLSAGIQG
jgi:hypothetical protein